MGAPQTRIYICSGVRLNNRYDHTIYFTDRAAQTSFFADHVVRGYEAYTFARRSWSLKLHATLEDAAAWNYLFYDNGDGKKWYYFINQIEYINDNTVELHLELDVLQTWLFDFDLLPSFVERQHTTTDNIGAHTVDEGLETGELVTTLNTDVNDLNDLCILFLSSIKPEFTLEGSDSYSRVRGQISEGVFSAMGVFAAKTSSWLDVSSALAQMETDGVIDGIVAMWMYPQKLVSVADETPWDDSQQTFKVVLGIDPIETTLTAPDTVSGYTPKNKKLLCYPYNFLYCSNNAGNGAVYRYERFMDQDELLFEVSGSLGADGSVRLFPKYYDGLATNYEAGLTLAGFPSCAWNADAYKIWLAQNQNTQNLAMAMSGLKIVGGAVGAVGSLAIGNAAGVLGSGASLMSGLHDIGSSLSMRADRDIQPPQARGSFSTSVNVTNNKQTFSFYRKSVNAEHARIIDDFFTMYGYKIHRVQTPNINARPAFTYIKTIGCHIAARLNNADATAIEAIFDKGVTFWKDGDKIGDYSQDNAV